MRTEQKTNVKNSVGRLTVVGLSVLLQVGWIVLEVARLSKYSAFFETFFKVLALFLALHIFGMYKNSAFKMPWIMLITVFPFVGICVYLVFGRNNVTKRAQERYFAVRDWLADTVPQEKELLDRLEQEDAGVANQCRYLCDYGNYPLHTNTDVRFFDQASDGFECQLKELAGAEKFIFMEYHAIQEAEAFERLKNVLADRAAAGVEVRLLYDDIGSVGFIDPSFIKRMEAVGVSCRVFNKVVPILNIFMHNRDHRKITVIDGKVGFTGGYNLADEYFNITHPYGYWKDTGIRLEGDAVRNLTRFFLEMWNMTKWTDEEVKQYFPDYPYRSAENSLVQPYADAPLDEDYTGEDVYLNLAKYAKKRLYITTPYLIISDEMTRELTMARQRGVDVVVITPGIPDKKIIYRVTRSYYAGLARRGVRIFEYTPGFLHQKQVLCDDELATVGTINFDFRSLYHHFENGVLLYRCSAIRDIEEDFQRIMAESREVTEKYANKHNKAMRLAQSALRLLAPMM